MVTDRVSGMLVIDRDSDRLVTMTETVAGW